MVLLLEHIGPAMVEHEAEEISDQDSGQNGDNLQVSPESRSPAIATNLFTPSSSGLDTLVLVFAIACLCNNQE